MNGTMGWFRRNQFVLPHDDYVYGDEDEDDDDDDRQRSYLPKYIVGASSSLRSASISELTPPARRYDCGIAQNRHPTKLREMEVKDMSGDGDETRSGVPETPKRRPKCLSRLLDPMRFDRSNRRKKKGTVLVHRTYTQMKCKRAGMDNAEGSRPHASVPPECSYGSVSLSFSFAPSSASSSSPSSSPLPRDRLLQPRTSDKMQGACATPDIADGAAAAASASTQLEKEATQHAGSNERKHIRQQRRLESHGTDTVYALFPKYAPEATSNVDRAETHRSRSPTCNVRNQLSQEDTASPVSRSRMCLGVSFSHPAKGATKFAPFSFQRMPIIESEDRGFHCFSPRSSHEQKDEEEADEEEHEVFHEDSANSMFPNPGRTNEMVHDTESDHSGSSQMASFICFDNPFPRSGTRKMPVLEDRPNSVPLVPSKCVAGNLDWAAAPSISLNVQQHTAKQHEPLARHPSYDLVPHPNRIEWHGEMVSMPLRCDLPHGGRMNRTQQQGINTTDRRRIVRH